LLERKKEIPTRRREVESVVGGRRRRRSGRRRTYTYSYTSISYTIMTIITKSWRRRISISSSLE
jgi:hypothetical protein